MNKMNISCDSKIWCNRYPGIKYKIRKIINKSIQKNKKLINKNVEITILLTNSDKMRFLNQKFRGKKKDTDILSFPYEKPSFFKKKIKNKKIYLGDLAISYNYIKRQNKKFEAVFKKILIHGYLHLIGYDHDSTKNFNKMEKMQNKILQSI
ncbi:MAG: rRNA maturation RNase YbeY [Candidatus Pelagibacter sp.]|nr:rRNA maturation RNase YbeY [Candidatus Pelagibacter sp.]